MAAVPGHQQHHRRVDHHHSNGQGPTDGEHHIGLNVQHDTVGFPDDHGDDSIARADAQSAAKHRAAAGINQIFTHDLRVGIAQGFQGADLGALLVDHPGHGGDAHQGSDQQEEHGNDPGNACHDIRAAVQIVITYVAGSVQNDQVRFVQGIDLLPGIRQFFFRILQLRFCIRKLLGYLDLGFLVILPALSKFFLAFVQEAPADLQLVVSIVQINLTGIKLLPAGSDLGLGFSKLLFLCFDGSIALIQSIHGIQGGLALGLDLVPGSYCLLVWCQRGVIGFDLGRKPVDLRLNGSFCGFVLRDRKLCLFCGNLGLQFCIGSVQLLHWNGGGRLVHGALGLGNGSVCLVISRFHCGVIGIQLRFGSGQLRFRRLFGGLEFRLGSNQL